MKIFLILLSLILMFSCTQNSSQKIDNSPKPVVQISPISNQITEINPLPTDETVALVEIKIPAFPTPEKTEDFLRKKNTIRLKKFGLYDLKNNRFQKMIWKLEFGKSAICLCEYTKI